MMKWGRKKPVSSSSSAASSVGLSRALPVSWFSRLSGSPELKPAKEKKKDGEDMSAKPRRNDINERSKRVIVEKEHPRLGDMESNEKFEEIMISVRKKVRDFQRETRGFQAMDRDRGALIMTPRIQGRRDQKLLEQKPKGAEVKTKRPERRRYGGEEHTLTKPANEWQKLKETKVREVKLKAEQRKSLYIKRELNSKVRVFSPRASEKCRVKAIEDLKKAKLRARENELVQEKGMESESFAVVKCSSDPQKDFRDSMIEMITENGINHPGDLKELLVCYLRLNADEYHHMIINVFQQVHKDMKFH